MIFIGICKGLLKEEYEYHENENTWKTAIIWLKVDERKWIREFKKFRKIE